MSLKFFDTPAIPETASKYDDILCELISNEGKWAKIGTGGSSKISYARSVLPKSVKIRQHKIGKNQYQIWAAYKPVD